MVAVDIAGSFLETSKVDNVYYINSRLFADAEYMRFQSWIKVETSYLIGLKLLKIPMALGDRSAVASGTRWIKRESFFSSLVKRNEEETSR